MEIVSPPYCGARYRDWIDSRPRWWWSGHVERGCAFFELDQSMSTSPCGRTSTKTVSRIGQQRGTETSTQQDRDLPFAPPEPSRLNLQCYSFMTVIPIRKRGRAGIGVSFSTPPRKRLLRTIRSLWILCNGASDTTTQLSWNCRHVSVNSNTKRHNSREIPTHFRHGTARTVVASICG